MSRYDLSRFRSIPLLALFYLGASLLLRLLLWWRFGLPAQVGAADLPAILSSGLANDLVTLIYVTVPLTLYLALVPERLYSSRWHRLFFAVLFALMIFGMLYLMAAEYFFFDEFDSRFNLVAVDYLIYPHEVLVNIWDSYPVVRVLLADAAVSLLLVRLSWSWLSKGFSEPSRRAGRLKIVLAQIVLVAVTAAGISTDTMAVDGNRVEEQISINGVSSLFRSFRTNDLSYSAFYRVLDHDQAFDRVRRDLAQGEGEAAIQPGAELLRTFPGNPDGLGKMNVVVMVEESFGADFVGAYGDSRGLTPHFDRLSREGLLFSNAFATGTRTVRGLEAITTSFPPIPSESILKRPGSENIANWGEIMNRQGYQSSFLYGGYGLFDNMNHFYENNGFAISDRKDIPDPTFANIWGVCDEDLFEHALDYFDARADEGKPFFSVIMSTSNHRPYTFPDGIPGIPPEGGGRKAGVRYADYAIGRFFEAAPLHPWFANTLFIIVADHDARVYGRAQVPVEHYRIPLLFYAPGRITPGVIDTPTSQIDIAPTVLGLLGLPYTAPFYGQNVLDLPPGTPRNIFLNHNHDVALLRGDRMAVLGLGEAADVYAYGGKGKEIEPASADADFLDLTAAYYQSAFDLFKSHRYRLSVAGTGTPSEPSNE